MSGSLSQASLFGISRNTKQPPMIASKYMATSVIELGSNLIR